MPRKSFGQEMHEVKNEILLLSSMVEEAVMESVQALKDNDLDRSRQVLENDLRINRKRFEIEISIIVLMATQQPAARDLRRLAANLEICSELERMGDYAKGMANINIRSEGLSLPLYPEGYLFYGGKSCGYTPPCNNNLCRRGFTGRESHPPGR